MARIIAAINMTLDGILDHTAGVPDAELHDHYRDLIANSSTLLYGRITYELMKFWQELAQTPSGERSMDEFALVMDRTPKIVFSETLPESGWKTARLAQQSLEQTVRSMREPDGKDVLIGSRSLILQLADLGLIDEFQFCIHPVIEGWGGLLFNKIKNRIMLDLTGTKTFGSGAVILYYSPKVRI